MQTNGGNHVINMNNGSVLFSNATTDLPIDISPDGLYLLSGNVVYNWDGAAYQSIHTFASDVMWAAFREDAPDQLLTIHSDGYARAYRVSDVSLLWAVQTPLPYLQSIPTYDPVSKRVLVTDYLLNVETQTFKAIPYAPYVGWTPNFHLVNGKIFAANGIVFDIGLVDVF